MKYLSIIIRADKNETENYLQTLEPLLNSFHPELIFINNSTDKINTSYKYSCCSFEENYDNFKKFCFSSSTGSRVMIIEKGMIITEELISRIKCILECENYLNISCNLKSYLSADKSLSFVREEVLVYTRGIKGFNKNTDITVGDFSLVEINKSSIETGIEKLVDGRYYNELFNWYENNILRFHTEYEAAFYTEIEKKKSSLKYYNEEKIDNIFTTGLENIIKSNTYPEALLRCTTYKSYLEIKKLCRDDIIDFNQMTYIMKAVSITESDLYWGCLFKKLIIIQPLFMDFLKFFTENMQRIFISHMLCSDNTFCNRIYDLIIKYDGQITIPEYDLETYVNMMTTYIEYMKCMPENPENKKRLIKVFDIYIDHAILTNRTDMNSSKEIFIHKFSDIKSNINNGNIKEALLALKRLSSEYNDEFKILRYYTQKLRYKTKCHPYVISICMIVRDEGKNLDRCLSSLKPLSDSNMAEIIIVDTGSKDNTVQIAQKYTNKVYTRPWNDDFSEARNYSILFAEGEYIFVVDGDEELKREEVKKIINEFSTEGFKDYNTFTVKLVSFTNTGLTQYAVLTQPRIFKNNGLFCYSSIVHNQPSLDLPVKHLDIELLHYGYIMTEDIREKKFQRTSGMLTAELQRNPQNIYYRFQLSTSNAMYGNLKEALKHVDIYMRLIKEQNLTDDTLLMYYNNAATIYIDNYKYDEAEKVSDEGLAMQPDFIDFIYYKAYILFLKEKYNDALIYIKRYLSLIDDYYKIDIANDGRFSFYTLSFKDEITRLLIITSYRLGIYDDCIENIGNIKDDRILQNCIHEIIGACINTGSYSELAKFYNSRVNHSGSCNMKYVFNYFLSEGLSNLTEAERQKCISAFSNTKLVDLADDSKAFHLNPDSVLSLIKIYDIDSMDFESAWNILKKIIVNLENYEAQMEPDPVEIAAYKRSAQFILHRTEKLITQNIIDVERLVTIFQKYMFLCSVLLNTGRIDLLEIRERLFISNVLSAFDELKKGNYINAQDYMKDAVVYYNDMDGIIDLSMQVLIPGYSQINGTHDKNNIEADNQAANYVHELKEKINSISGDNQAQHILDIFNEYDKSEVYDSDLITAKAIALISCDRLNEAQECVENGLKKYINDFNLLSNLCILYHLKHDYRHSVEIYAKMRMVYPTQKNAAIYKMIQKALPQLNNCNKKVLHGTMDLSDNINTLVSMLKNKGIDTKSFNYLTRAGYSSDYIIDANLFDSGELIRDRSIDAASKLIPQFDIFHFHYGTTLYFDHSDLPIIRELNKKIMMQYYGDEVRLYSQAAKYNPYIDINGRNDDEIKRKLNMISKYVHCCIVNDYEIYEYVKDYFEKTVIIRPMIEISEYNPAPVKIKKDAFTIIHTPTSTDLKGTNCILSAVESLKDKYHIDFKLVQELPPQKAMEIYREADLIIDRLSFGSYSESAAEAMALAKPVICYISEFMKDKYPKDLPIIAANPDNIIKRIEYCINNRDMLYDSGINGRLYAIKYHNVNNEIKKIIELYETL